MIILFAFLTVATPNTVEITDSLVAARIEALSLASPAFGEAWKAIEASGIRITIGSDSSAVPKRYRVNSWAGLTVFEGNVRRVTVVVRVGWLQNLHQQLGLGPDAFMMALDELIIHELYGHVVPVIATRNMRDTCTDPAPNETMTESCVGRRIDIIKRELSR